MTPWLYVTANTTAALEERLPALALALTTGATLVHPTGPVVAALGVAAALYGLTRYLAAGREQKSQAHEGLHARVESLALDLQRTQAAHKDLAERVNLELNRQAVRR